MVRALLGALVLGATGCEEDPCPPVSMLDGPEGLVVTEGEHGVGVGRGWGQADCSGCHALERLHRVDCAGVDLAEVRERALRGGVEGCMDCHGDNGVPR